MAIPPPPEEMEARLIEALHRFSLSSARWEWLKGDGSNRAYARIHDHHQSAIAMVLADPDPHKQAEEIEEGPAEEIPFLAIQKILEEYHLPVPALYHQAGDLGVIILEDLGDTLLENCFSSGIPVDLYQQAVDLLIPFQKIPKAPNLLFRRRYSLSLLLWEVEHFFEYGISARLSLNLPDRLREGWKKRWGEILEPLAKDPLLPVHRDYHSRNLMVDSRGRLRWIDFQDALLGHGYYDLASLLYDAYVEIPDGLRSDLFHRFRRQALAAGLPSYPERDLYLLAIQRMLKAAGRFVYFDRVKGKPQYLRYVPTLLERIRRIFLGDPGVLPAPLLHLLKEMKSFVPEWR